MEKAIKLTIKRIIEVKGYLAQLQTDDNNKFNYAIKKLKKRLDEGMEKDRAKLNEDIENMRVKYAAVYPDDFEKKEVRGHFVLNEKQQYTYTRENAQEFAKENTKTQEKFLAVEKEIDPYYIEEDWAGAKDVDLFLKDELTGLLFKSETTTEKK